MFGRILIGTALAAVAAVGVVRLSSSPDPIHLPPPRALQPAAEPKPKGLARPEQLRREELPDPFGSLKPLAERKRAPGPDDWLAHHPEEGQSLGDWRVSWPVRATDEQHTIYLQPLGAFTDPQREVLAAASDYIGRYFGVPVKTLPSIPLSVVPASAKRRNPSQGQQQILTRWVLAELTLRRPDDALAYIALTPVDLYPDETWNFVYGQATLQQRVGVWSMWRFGDPAASSVAFDRALRRTIATAVHELGHMLTIEHCVAWECVMNGINHDEEAERAPLEPCPADLAKLCAATRCDPHERFDKLIAFWEEHPAASPNTLQYLKSARARVAAASAPAAQ